MRLTDDKRAALTYHARMFALAVFGGAAFFVTLFVIVYVLLAMGVIHGEFR